MLAFRLASQGERVNVMFDAAGRNLNAYAVRSDRGEIWLTLINKDAAREASVRVVCPATTTASTLRLTAPSLTSKDGVLLGGSAVSSSGQWSPGTPELLRVTSGEMEIDVPAASAALVQLK
jgi:hypothetical protein